MLLVLRQLETQMARSSQPKAPYPRTRTERSFVRSAGGNATIVKFSSTPGQYTTDASWQLNGGIRGYSRSCSDIVTPGYAVLRDQGHIFNNPFSSVQYTMDWGGAGPDVRYTGSMSPWPSGTNHTATYPVSQLHANNNFVLLPFEDAYNIPYAAPLVYTGLDSLVRKAKTEALSNVDQSIAQGLVGVVELKRTLASLINPLSAIRQYLNRWQLKRTRKGYKLHVSDGQGLIPAVANQYLELYYGLMPTVRDIESYLEAYVKSEIRRERQTARGQAFDTYDNKTFWKGDRVVLNSSQYDATYSYHEEICARSGILYRPSPTTLRSALGLRWGDVIPSAYEIMPWSFFIDYFSNLGTLIGALTPRQGVEYQAAWDTVIRRHVWRSEVTGTWIKGSFTHAREGSEWAERVLEVRLRSPTGVYANVGLITHTGVWESKAKVAAVLSLLLQQVASRVVPPAIWRA